VPVRVLLLARPCGGWWQGVRAALQEHDLTAARSGHDLTAAVTADHLAPLVPAPADRLLLFDAARDRFATLLGFTGIASVARPPKLGTDLEYGRALTVQMAALAGVDAAIRGATPPVEAVDLSTYLLDRERWHWQKLHAKSRIADGGGTDETAITTSPTVMAHTVYTAILTRPLPHPGGAEVLVRAGIASQTDVGRVLIDHAVCYPPTDQSTVLEPLYPDRLAEDFLALTSPGHPHGGADPWAATALSALLTPDPDPPAYARQAITVLIEATQRWPHLAQHLFPLLQAHPQLAMACGGAALTTLADTPGIDLAVLEAIEPLLPAKRHIDLDIAAAAITTKLTEHRLASTTDPAERARLYATHAKRLIYAGMLDGALPPAQKAVDLHRQLAGTNPQTHLPDLAGALNNLSIILSEMGRREQAITTAEEASRTFRQLARKDPLAYLPDLAKSLQNVGICLWGLGREEEALAPAEEAVAIHRRLAQIGRVFSFPDFAGSLHVLNLVLSRLGRKEEALGAAEEAVKLYRGLDELNPAAYRRDFAASLNSLGNLLRELGRGQEALATAEEATGIYRHLAATNPHAHHPALAGSLHNLSVILWELGRTEEALISAEEAMIIFRRLATTGPHAHQPGLATSLSSLSGILWERGRAEEALSVAEEAVAIQRRLAAAYPEAHRPDLGSLLQNVGGMLSKSGRKEAVAMVKEAVAIQRQLAAANPEAHQPGLAAALATFAWVCANLNTDLTEALEAITESISDYQNLALDLPQRYGERLFAAYQTAADVLDGLGRTGEAVEVRRQLDEAIAGQPDAG
jgi:tetratricopeptide (TPR) repeat protein